MKRKISSLLIICFLLSAIFIVPNSVSAKETYKKDLMIKLAKNSISNMSKGDFKKSMNDFSPNLKAMLNENAISQAWNSVVLTYGKFTKFNAAIVTKYPPYDLVYITTSFGSQALNIVFTFNQNATIDGFTFQPGTIVVKPENITEQSVSFGQSGWKIPGTLTLPKGNGPFPAVVLVHGSGANDRDETLGPNKVFRDIAWGLAEKGIAVLRYDKRTFLYGIKMRDFTVKEEVLDDAIAAVDLLKHQANIDKNKLFVIGHSLGGYLIPKIGELDTSLKGLISLAGPYRPLEDIMPEQIKYLLSLQANLDQKTKDSQLEAYLKSAEKIKKRDYDASTPPSQLLGATAGYWDYLRNYDPGKTVKNIQAPMLFLQGLRDYQVTIDNLNLWKEALKDKKNVEFKTYNSLNHMFLEGQGTPNPDEYYIQSRFSKDALNDISEWILKQN